MTNRRPVITPGSDPRERLAAARLQLLIGRADGDVLGLVRAAVGGGVDVVQLRWKGGRTDEVAALAEELVRAVGDRALVLVNDDVEAALAGGAHGVHVGEEDAPVEEVRRRVGPTALIGLSTHDAAAARGAKGRGADYIGFGAMFETTTKARPRVIGPEALATLGGLDVPCFAIGGIDRTNVARVVAGGATRIAVSRAIVGAEDPRAAASELRAALERASPEGRSP